MPGNRGPGTNLPLPAGKGYVMGKRITNLFSRLMFGLGDIIIVMPMVWFESHNILVILGELHCGGY